MIESNNKEYGGIDSTMNGFFGAISNAVIVERLKEKAFDAVAQMLVTDFDLSEAEAAYVLDNRTGRDLADSVSDSESIQAMVVKAKSTLGKQMAQSKTGMVGESKKLSCRLLEAGGNYLSKRERKLINDALYDDPILSGREKVQGLGQAVSSLAVVLDKLSFSLDMVSGDLLLGGKGSRALSFRRALPPGSDPFSEGPEVDSRISFNWENLNRDEYKNYEVVCYLT